MSVVLLIDGDIIAYVAAAACQRPVANPQEDAFGYVWAYANAKEGRAVLDNMMARLKELFSTEEAGVALSGADNWRKAILPSYKSNRDDLQRPVLLSGLKQHLRDKHGAVSVENLEADDLIGIWATDPLVGASTDSQVIVTKDKDFKGIPGAHFTLWDLDYKGNPRVRTISEWEAKRFHLIQALAGDRVDGYAGCPGIGMERAAKIIDSPQRLVPRESVLTAGKNKGTKTIKWFAEPTDDYWACIVSHYRKAGLTEADALTTAKVAKILLWEDYQGGLVRTWTPERLRD